MAVESSRRPEIRKGLNTRCGQARGVATATRASPPCARSQGTGRDSRGVGQLAFAVALMAMAIPAGGMCTVEAPSRARETQLPRGDCKLPARARLAGNYRAAWSISNRGTGTTTSKARGGADSGQRAEEGKSSKTGKENAHSRSGDPIDDARGDLVTTGKTMITRQFHGGNKAAFAAERNVRSVLTLIVACDRCAVRRTMLRA